MTPNNATTKVAPMSANKQMTEPECFMLVSALLTLSASLVSALDLCLLLKSEKAPSIVIHQLSVVHSTMCHLEDVNTGAGSHLMDHPR